MDNATTNKDQQSQSNGKSEEADNFASKNAPENPIETISSMDKANTNVQRPYFEIYIPTNEEDYVLDPITGVHSKIIKVDIELDDTSYPNYEDDNELTGGSSQEMSSQETPQKDEFYLPTDKENSVLDPITGARSKIAKVDIELADTSYPNYEDDNELTGGKSSQETPKNDEFYLPTDKEISVLDPITGARSKIAKVDIELDDTSYPNYEDDNELTGGKSSQEPPGRDMFYFYFKDNTYINELSEYKDRVRTKYRDEKSKNDKSKKEKSKKEKSKKENTD